MLPSETQSQVLCPFPSPCPKSSTKTLSMSLLVQGHCPLVLGLVLVCAGLAEGDNFINCNMQSHALNYYMHLKKPELVFGVWFFS